MLSRVLQESFFAHVSARAAPLSRITRRSLHPPPQFVAGGNSSGSYRAFSPGGDLLDADSMGQARLDRFSASGFRGLLVCPLCAERAALDKRRQDFIRIAAPAVLHAADAARFQWRRTRVSSLIMRISIIKCFSIIMCIFNNKGYLH